MMYALWVSRINERDVIREGLFFMSNFYPESNSSPVTTPPLLKGRKDCFAGRGLMLDHDEPISATDDRGNSSDLSSELMVINWFRLLTQELPLDGRIQILGSSVTSWLSVCFSPRLFMSDC